MQPPPIDLLCHYNISLPNGEVIGVSRNTTIHGQRHHYLRFQSKGFFCLNRYERFFERFWRGIFNQPYLSLILEDDRIIFITEITSAELRDINTMKTLPLREIEKYNNGSIFDCAFAVDDAFIPSPRNVPNRQVETAYQLLRLNAVRNTSSAGIVSRCFLIK